MAFPKRLRHFEKIGNKFLPPHMWNISKSQKKFKWLWYEIRKKMFKYFDSVYAMALLKSRSQLNKKGHFFPHIFKIFQIPAITWKLYEPQTGKNEGKASSSCDCGPHYTKKFILVSTSPVTFQQTISIL